MITEQPYEPYGNPKLPGAPTLCYGGVQWIVIGLAVCL